MQAAAVRKVEKFSLPQSRFARQPLTAAVPFVATRHFPTLWGITLLRGGKKTAENLQNLFPPSDEGGGFCRRQKTEGETK